MRIPTILGLALLLVAISLGIFIFLYRQKIEAQKKVELTPIDIQTVNISDSQVSIAWQTKTPSTGSVSWGTDEKLDTSQPDDRDQNQASSRQTHFTTIKNLKPETSYSFKVQNNNFSFPIQPIQFKTAKILDNQTVPDHPIVGTVIDSSLQPVDEGLVFLKLDQGSILGTYITTVGNYLLPLTALRDQTLSKQFTLGEKTPASLLITKGDLKSNIKITLPQGKQPLPPIILGQDLDLSALSTQTNTVNYDLNGDGQINSLDLAIILKNFNQTSPDPIADLNQDGIVNQVDIDMLKEALSENSQSK